MNQSGTRLKTNGEMGESLKKRGVEYLWKYMRLRESPRDGEAPWGWLQHEIVTIPRWRTGCRKSDGTVGWSRQELRPLEEETSYSMHSSAMSQPREEPTSFSSSLWAPADDPIGWTQRDLGGRKRLVDEGYTLRGSEQGVSWTRMDLGSQRKPSSPSTRFILSIHSYHFPNKNHVAAIKGTHKIHSAVATGDVHLGVIPFKSQTLITTSFIHIKERKETRSHTCYNSHFYSWSWVPQR